MKNEIKEQNYDVLKNDYYGHVNQVINLSDNKVLVETHIADWVNADENWEIAEWYVVTNDDLDNAILIAKCNGYDGVDWEISLALEFEDEELVEKIEELVTPYTLSGLVNECHDAQLDDAEEGDEDVKIVVTGYYFGHDPHNYPTILQDENYEDKIFSTYEEAQEWIDEAESETYYLSHNEAGRPSYRIVKG